eukprot:TRINITY_DN2393_c0_g1_i1.p1 TRINITY_DN2393_c0_g1~~TRINITY_DN2393_c0_g1_i1.p1  ORF type:complete len:691 (+),score=195.41 TRINITY_DN2393_c0_g1_i1:90-2162(+)
MAGHAALPSPQEVWAAAGEASDAVQSDPSMDDEMHAALFGKHDGRPGRHSSGLRRPQPLPGCEQGREGVPGPVAEGPWAVLTAAPASGKNRTPSRRPQRQSDAAGGASRETDDLASPGEERTAGVATPVRGRWRASSEEAYTPPPTHAPATPETRTKGARERSPMRTASARAARRRRLRPRGAPASPRGGAARLDANASAAARAFPAFVRELEEVWQDVGVDEAHTSRVLAEVWGKVEEVLSSAFDAEAAYADGIHEQLEAQVKQIAHLAETLQLAAWRPRGGDTLLDSAADAEEQRRRLEAVRDDRVAMVELLRGMHDELAEPVPAKDGGVKVTGAAPFPLSSDPPQLWHDLGAARVHDCVEAVNAAARDRLRTLRDSVAAEHDAVSAFWAKLTVQEAERARFKHRFQDLQPSGAARDAAKSVTETALRRWLDAPDADATPVAALCGLGGWEALAGFVRETRAGLESEWRTRLRLQIDETAELLRALWAEYHDLTKDAAFAPNAVQQRRANPYDMTEGGLALVEGEVLDMEKRIETVKTIVAVLRKRDEILRQKTEMEAAAADTQRLTDRSRNMAQVLLHEEKLRKTIKTQLPKLEAQLHGFCRDYRSRHGHPFVYCGAPLEHQLRAAADQDQQQQQQQQQPKAATRGRNKSPGPSKPTTRYPSTTRKQPAPAARAKTPRGGRHGPNAP